MTAKIYRFQRPETEGEMIELRDTEAACNLLQRELMKLVFRQRQGAFTKLSENSGICVNAISNICFGETRAPRFNTVVRLLDALGWSLLASR